MHKKPVIYLGIVLVLTLVVIFGREFVKGKVNPSEVKTQTAEQPQSKNAPAHLKYWVMFHHIALLNKQADQAEGRGEDGTRYRQRYQRFAHLNDPQAQILTTVALDTYKQVMDTDARAKAIVLAVRSRYPGGKLNGGELPQMPEELKQLQSQRDGIITAGYNRLKQGFGQQDFPYFEKFVEEQIGTKMYSIDRNTMPNRPSREPQLLHKAGRVQ